MQEKKEKYKRWGWGKMMILALLVVAGIRFFLLESFYISSSSMETAVLNGDYLLVNKFRQIDPVRRNAVMLFTSPLEKDSSQNALFLSRCIGMPGDTLVVGEKGFTINGKEFPKSPYMLSRYRIDKKAEQSLFRQMNRFDIPVRDKTDADSAWLVSLNTFEEFRLREELSEPVNLLFTPVPAETYTLVVPRKGKAYRLDSTALIACKEIIIRETGGRAVFRHGKLYLDGRETTFFFFKQDYCWMLSDNTTEGIDSRHLGFIPESNLKGRAFLIWMSKKPGTDLLHGYRWNRIFNILY